MLYQCYKMGFDELRSQASCFKGNLISFLLFAVLFGNVAWLIPKGLNKTSIDNRFYYSKYH